MTDRAPITIDYALGEMRLIALGIEDWLNKFSSGPKKRPDPEIDRYMSKLEVVRWVIAAMERKQGA